ncbi:MAG: hypothetical protein H7Y89_03950 [Steroidobacteraceae bacterium]|nr:hypothetical protein [Steroidobacteraceae bacterium]
MFEKSHTREQQLAILQKMGKGSLLERAEVVSWLSVAALIALGFWKSWVPSYMGAAFIAIVAASSRATLINLRNAARGEREGVRVRGSVEIVVKPDSESPSYFATTTDRGVRWKMQFIATGWKPVDGSFPAELVYVRGAEWPVLVLLDAGIIVPRFKPARA